MSWYHLSYDATGTDENPSASNDARGALLKVLHASLSVESSRLYRPTKFSILFHTEQAYLQVYNAINSWSLASKTVYVLSAIAVNAQGRNLCVWNPNAGLSQSIQEEYRQLLSMRSDIKPVAK